MPRSLERREFVAGLCAGLVCPAAGGLVATTAVQEIASLEQRTGGRLGVAALYTGSGVRLAHRAGERFAMCSTFKLMLSAAVLTRVERGTLRLEQPVSYSRTQLLPNSPVTAAHVAEGTLPLERLAQAALEESDNTAANLLLALIGGPPGYTAYLRGLGDSTTRLDRNELALNSNLPGDPRDTTTPAAMLADMQRTLLGEALAEASRSRLLDWMRNCRTGGERLRAGLPPGWSAGDKTGTGDHGAVNDLAIFWPPGRRPPVLVVCYMSQSERSTDILNAAQARIGAIVAALVA
jgi:beta-lactamase class A